MFTHLHSFSRDNITHYNTIRTMKKKQLRKYCAPKCTSVYLATSRLLETSMPGQHKPGKHATGPTGADASMEDWQEG